MKNIFFYLNFIFVATGFVGAIIFGTKVLSFYVLLALFQLISGLILLITRSYKKQALKKIIVYWLLVSIYFLVVIEIISNEIIKFLIIPILIATYHCYMTYKLTKS